MGTKAELREFLETAEYFSDQDLQAFVAPNTEVGSLRSAQGVASWAGWVKPPNVELWTKKTAEGLREPPATGNGADGADDLKLNEEPVDSPLRDMDPDRVQQTRFSQIERQMGLSPTQNPDAERWFRILRSVGTNANLAATTSLMLAEIPSDDLTSIKGALADIKLLTVNQRDSAYNIFSREQGTVPPKKEAQGEAAPVSGMNKPIWGAIAGEVIQSPSQGLTYHEAEAMAAGQRRREAREMPAQQPPQPTTDPIEVAKVIAGSAATPQDTLDAINAGREMAAPEGPPPPGMDPGTVSIVTAMMTNQQEEARANRDTTNKLLEQMRDDREERRHTESMEMMRTMAQSMAASKKGELTEIVETLQTFGINISDLIGRFLNPQEKVTAMMDGVQVLMTPQNLLEMRKLDNQKASIEAVKDNVLPTVVKVLERMDFGRRAEPARPMPGDVPVPQPVAVEPEPEPEPEPEVGERWPCTACQTPIVVPKGSPQVECPSCEAKYLTAEGARWLESQPLIDKPTAEEEVPVPPEAPPAAEVPEEHETVTAEPETVKA